MDPDLKKAIEAIKAAPKISIHGKQYTQVATRVEYFRECFGLNLSIETDFLESYDPNVVRVKAVIRAFDGRILSSGLAEEDRRNGKINATSALENAETSAIGRALAALGLMGGEYASTNEMEQAGAMDFGNGKAFDQALPPANERQMVNSRPEFIPSVPAAPQRNHYIPEGGELFDGASKVCDLIVHIETVDELTRYWAELGQFLKVVQTEDPSLFSEVKAAFAVRNKQLRGTGNV